PDFVAISWYKVLGYPTGLGCLVARWPALARLRRPWFAGGTITAVSVQGDWHQMSPDEAAFEDGTLNFLAIPDVECGLSWIDSIGIDTVHTRVGCLTGWLLHRMSELRHSNGAQMLRVYGPTDERDRGGTISFNVLDPDGRVVDDRLVARESAARGFSLRTGCFCNPGAGEGAFGITKRALRGSRRWRLHSLDEYLSLLGIPAAGAVRASFGIASTLEDAERLLDFLGTTYLDRVPDRTGLVPRDRC
ncbi:MAG: aminotransferase class V-fold PLP-dependent enzyme, partial [Micromonosporaceae bacterium]|nr:aminotransferase class V-fold PLP-dependent enzyme [Micromonosporaceae bacterium]